MATKTNEKAARAAGCVDTVSFEKRFENGRRSAGQGESARAADVEAIGREQQRRSVAYSRSRGQL